MDWGGGGGGGEGGLVKVQLTPGLPNPMENLFLELRY